MKHHQTKSEQKYPFWLKTSVILIGLSILVIILNYAKFILMPLAFSAFIAMLLNPLVKIFDRMKVGRAISIILTLLVVVIVFASILTLISAQLIQFTEQLPEVTDKLKSISTDAIIYLEETIGVSEEEQGQYLQQAINNLIDRSGDFAGSLVSATTNAFTVMTLMPIFIFFLLYYQEMFRTFFQKIFEAKGRHSTVDDLLDRVQQVTQNYLIGMLTVIGILAVLNTTGLLIVGLDHALFFGVFASLLAIIPYIGIIIGSLPPILFALLLTDSLLTPVLVIAVFATVQFLEGNFITPRIVGSKVSINPFVALLALIIGGNLWGISGMILFVPLIGILKVVFDQIPEMKPYGYILGNKVEYNEK